MTTSTDFDHWRESFSFLDPGLTGRRWVDVVNRLREECPVAHSTAHVADDDERGFTVLTRYEDIQFAHNHPEMYSSCPVTMPTAGLPRPWIPIESDPPLHRGYKNILADLLSHRSQARKEPEYRAIARRILGGFVERGEGDLYDEFCVPFPLTIIMDAFDIPADERQHVFEQMLLFVHRPGAMEDPAETAKIVVAASAELNRYLLELIAKRRGSQSEDILSILSRSHIDGVPLRDNEIVDYSMLMIPAGFETTSFSMSYIFATLDERPELRQRLIDEPSLIPTFIEEVLRFETPTKALARTVVVDHEVGGQTLRRGDRVLLVWAAADRDPRVFDSPDDFVVDRKPNRHFGFGSGAHLCSGIHMARVEMRIAVEEILAAMPDYRFVDRSQLEEVPGMTWTLHNLQARWDGPRAAEAFRNSGA